MPKCDIPVRVDALFLLQSLCMWQSMWLHCVCKVWASHLRRGLRSHHSIVDFFLGLLGSRFSVIGSRKSKSECIFGIYARCTFQNTRKFFSGVFVRRFSVKSSGAHMIFEKSRFTMGIPGWRVFSENQDMHCEMLKRLCYDCIADSIRSLGK